MPATPTNNAKSWSGTLGGALSGALTAAVSSAASLGGFGDAPAPPDDSARADARLKEEAAGLDADGHLVLSAVASKLLTYEIDVASVDPELVIRVVRSETNNQGVDSAPEERAAKGAAVIHELLMWRREEGVEDILDAELPFTADFHANWPVTIHGNDEFGHPVVAERIEEILPEGLGRHMDQAAVLRHRVQIMEAVSHLKRRTGLEKGHAVYKHVWVIDLAGLKLAHFTGDVRLFVLELVALCTDKYTETLSAMWLVNAPMVFRAVWAARPVPVTGPAVLSAILLGESANDRDHIEWYRVWRLNK